MSRPMYNEEWQTYWRVFDALAELAKAVYLPMGERHLSITTGQFLASYDGKAFRFDGPASAGRVGMGQGMEPTPYTGEPSLSSMFLHSALGAAAEAIGDRVFVRIADYLIGEADQQGAYVGLTGMSYCGRLEQDGGPKVPPIVSNPAFQAHVPDVW